MPHSIMPAIDQGLMLAQIAGMAAPKRWAGVGWGVVAVTGLIQLGEKFFGSDRPGSDSTREILNAISNLEKSLSDAIQAGFTGFKIAEIENSQTWLKDTINEFLPSNSEESDINLPDKWTDQIIDHKKTVDTAYLWARDQIGVTSYDTFGLCLWAAGLRLNLSKVGIIFKLRETGQLPQDVTKINNEYYNDFLTKYDEFVKALQPKLDLLNAAYKVRVDAVNAVTKQTFTEAQSRLDVFNAQTADNKLGVADARSVATVKKTLDVLCQANRNWQQVN